MTIEGIGPIAEVSLITVLVAPYLIWAWPLIVRTGRGGVVAAIAGIIMTALVITAFAIPPFTPDRPYKMKMLQTYRPQDGVSEVEIRSYTPIDQQYLYNRLPASLTSQFGPSKILEMQQVSVPTVIPPRKLSKRDFNPSSSSSWYLSGVPPPTINWTYTTESSFDAAKNERTVSITVISPLSNTCDVEVPAFPIGTNTSDGTFIAYPTKAPNTPLAGAGQYWRIAQIRTVGAEFTWVAKFRQPTELPGTLVARVTCYAAEWSKNPGMQQVYSQMPDWVRVAGDGWYIGGVQRDIKV
jgi:hypothetical protein